MSQRVAPVLALALVSTQDYLLLALGMAKKGLQVQELAQEMLLALKLARVSARVSVSAKVVVWVGELVLESEGWYSALFCSLPSRGRARDRVRGRRD